MEKARLTKPEISKKVEDSSTILSALRYLSRCLAEEEKEDNEEAVSTMDALFGFLAQQLVEVKYDVLRLHTVTVSPGEGFDPTQKP